MNRTTISIALALVVAFYAPAWASIQILSSPPSGYVSFGYSVSAGTWANASQSSVPLGTGSISASDTAAPFNGNDSALLSWSNSASVLQVSYTLTAAPPTTTVYSGFLSEGNDSMSTTVYFQVTGNDTITVSGSWQLVSGSATVWTNAAIHDLTSPTIPTLVNQVAPSNNYTAQASAQPFTLLSSVYSPAESSFALTAGDIYEWNPTVTNLSQFVALSSSAQLQETLTITDVSQSEGSTTPEPATMIVWSLLGAASWLGMRVWRRGRPAGRHWSEENRQAILDIVSR